MIRRPPRSTQSRSSAASDVYKRQTLRLDLVRQVSQSEGLQGLRSGLAVSTQPPVLIEFPEHSLHVRHHAGDAPVLYLSHYPLADAVVRSGGTPDVAQAALDEPHPGPGIHQFLDIPIVSRHRVEEVFQFGDGEYRTGEFAPAG